MVERAYKFRFYPTVEQESLLRRTLGCVRLVYNLALATRTEAWYERQERIDYKQTSSLLTSWKKLPELEFLNEVSSVPLQQGLRNLQKAFGNFWAKRAKYPRFKKKRNGGSAEFTKAAFKWRHGKLYLAKCAEPLNIVWSRLLPQDTAPSTVTVKLDPSGRWFVSLLVDDQTVKPLPPPSLPPTRGDVRGVGIDAGVTSLISTSDGEKIANPKHFNRLYKKLKVAQKELSRKTKGAECTAAFLPESNSGRVGSSNNRQKARLKVARIHAKIKDLRTDFLHKLTTRLVRENSVLAIEDLSVRNMVRHPTLARSLSDAAWGELYDLLEYKCQWYGRQLVKIDRFFPSSKRCNHCGFVVDKLSLDVRSWDCPGCGTVGIDRDINAGKNILAAGLAGKRLWSGRKT